MCCVSSSNCRPRKGAPSTAERRVERRPVFRWTDEVRAPLARRSRHSYRCPTEASRCGTVLRIPAFATAGAAGIRTRRPRRRPLVAKVWFSSPRRSRAVVSYRASEDVDTVRWTVRTADMKPVIICFAGDVWAGNPHSRHHLMRRLTPEFEVLFVESIPMRSIARGSMSCDASLASCGRGGPCARWHLPSRPATPPSSPGRARGPQGAGHHAAVPSESGPAALEAPARGCSGSVCRSPRRWSADWVNARRCFITRTGTTHSATWTPSGCEPR